MSRYGAISRVLPYLGPQGAVFFVANTTSTYLADLMASFPSDKGGVSRVFTSLTAASAMCVAGRGDVILVLPGETETVTAAGGIQLSADGVTIVGMGNGQDRPTFTFSTATTADMNVDAANITIENCIFDLTGVDALAAPIDVNAANFTMRNCEVITANVTNQAVLGILTDVNGTGMTLLNNQFLGTPTAGTAAAVRIVGGANHIVRGNLFIGSYTTTLGAIDNATTAITNSMFENNFISNTTASSTVAMNFQSASTGMISNNRMQILSGTAPIVGPAMSWVGENYYAATIATAGTLI